ncbi:NUDIX hydrolase [Clostridium ganghwense]|uniref:NUDIX domain-containing protein n=1 Tax=Clostridium ganghwense TaxID=312089 RepID=A0ABT4CNQ0_9CLOT|nr:NUDIX domain-containing protein [Clostridium ganghwense]MCY6370685.1 NUDIX domain-containing protein [Clostridium ganghwense]
MDCGFKNKDGWFRYRAAAIIIEDGNVLFAKNELDSYYYSIGGGVHLGEKAEDAVKREVLEETGIAYEVDRLVFIHENFFEGSGTLDGLMCHEITFYFLMKSRGTKELNSNSYTQGVREYMHWLPINKLKNYVAYPNFFADKLLNFKNGVEHIITCE